LLLLLLLLTSSGMKGRRTELAPSTTSVIESPSSPPVSMVKLTRAAAVNIAARLCGIMALARAARSSFSTKPSKSFEARANLPWTSFCWRGVFVYPTRRGGGGKSDDGVRYSTGMAAVDGGQNVTVLYSGDGASEDAFRALAKPGVVERVGALHSGGGDGGGGDRSVLTNLRLVEEVTRTRFIPHLSEHEAAPLRASGQLGPGRGRVRVRSRVRSDRQGPEEGATRRLDRLALA